MSYIAMLIDMNSLIDPYYTLWRHILKEICNQKVDREYYCQSQNLLAHVLNGLKCNKNN